MILLPEVRGSWYRFSDMAKKKASKLSLVNEQIFQLRISLMLTKPLVWRRVLVPGTFSLEALHSVLQISMGWQMSHLYDFQIGKVRFAEPDEFDRTPVKSLGTKLSTALRGEKSFFYNYDFGDGWRHEVTVEAVTDRDRNLRYPICIAGENACPPEDCGGPSGYESLLEKIRNPKDPEHAEMMAWIGGFFDPLSFDPNRINSDLLWTIDWAVPNDQGLYIPFSGLPSDDDGLFS